LLVVVVVVVGASGWASAHGSGAPLADRVSVGLLDTDQLGVAVSRQAAAQSPDAVTRAAAAALATAYQEQADTIDAWLTRRGVGAAARIALREPTRAHPLPAGTTCVLMRPGALGRLAGTGPDRFDGAFAALVRSHAAMRARSVAVLARPSPVRRMLAASQRRLRAAESASIRAATAPAGAG
jgi:hypothetical protein